MRARVYIKNARMGVIDTFLGVFILIFFKIVENDIFHGLFHDIKT